MSEDPSCSLPVIPHYSQLLQPNQDRDTYRAAIQLAVVRLRVALDLEPSPQLELIFADALEDLPAEALAVAFARAEKRETQWPVPAQMRIFASLRLIESPGHPVPVEFGMYDDDFPADDAEAGF